MIGDTKSATLTFSGPIRSKIVYYYRGELVCRPFHETVQVFKLCRVRGQGTDVCPHTDRQIFRMCGLENPSPEHSSELNCASCGGPHTTGDRSCTKRLKKPRAPRSSRPQAARQPRWFSTEDEEEANGRTTFMEQRTTSRSRSRGRVIDAYAKVCPATASAEKEGDACPPPCPETSSTAMPENREVFNVTVHRTSPSLKLTDTPPGEDLKRPSGAIII
ncbi:hypothetical protein HPB52_006504 [Rhipicephalus sanguineus]|uniref:Uncharacterized protein n=1 Tax=Rhipicephalus sanguineus TaxID=34632 RepID=A0A9D4PK86_RHISA|nr:hypothetical protein HPB52_006504 [Rhipicephalus sanguineus]